MKMRSNLGVMDRETALQLADSKGLQIIQVRKETPESEAVFRLASRKQLWDDEKRMKQRVWRMWLSERQSKTFTGTDWCAHLVHCRGQVL